MMVVWLFLVMFVMSVDMLWGSWGSMVKVVSGVLMELVSVGVKYIFNVMLVSLMVLLVFSNMYGLGVEAFSMYYPWVMTLSILWWLMLLVDDMKFSGKFVSHFVPTGVSIGMGVILSVLELISHFIRPLTLCVRLSTNITAGHVMLSMVSLFCYSSVMLSVVLMIILILVMLLEVVVAILQAYIFSSLLLLYHSEFV
nr:ATP synthase F0 subunit 6 [Moniliformis sp. XH-2020]